jgi:hypothetical protein
VRKSLWLLSTVAVVAGCGPVGAPQMAHGSATTSHSAARGTTSTGSGAQGTPGPMATGTAVSVLAGLPVKGRAPKTGYDRERFGQAWSDVDRNGCDTRNDILRRDLDDVSLKQGTSGCVVLSGTLKDPYTGTTIEFLRGVDTSAEVQIDHVVALSDAWQKGAQQLAPARREKLANDPLNLLAVDGPTNGAKGDGDAATWLPPRKGFRCAYVARQVAVKARYDLWVTSAEKDAITRILQRCPSQKVPTSSVIISGDDQGSPTSPTSTQKPSSSGAATVDPRYDSCADAVADGSGPYRKGEDPEYDWYRDGDGDGVVCE